MASEMKEITTSTKPTPRTMTEISISSAPRNPAVNSIAEATIGMGIVTIDRRGETPRPMRK